MRVPRRGYARHDKTGRAGAERVRRACLWHPNVTGCRYALAGLIDTGSGAVLATWSGAPGASPLA